MKTFLEDVSHFGQHVSRAARGSTAAKTVKITSQACQMTAVYPTQNPSQIGKQVTGVKNSNF